MDRTARGLDSGLEMLRRSGINLIAFLAPDQFPDQFTCTVRDAGIPLEDYNRLLLLGHGGRQLWRVLSGSGLMSDPDPVDRFSQEQAISFVEDHLQVDHYHSLYPGPLMIPLQQLGEAAGWHHDSPLGIGINPLYGLWFGYRAAVLLRAEVSSSEPQPGCSPCDNCIERPCISRCPVGAIHGTSAPDIQACVGHRLALDSVCATTCLSRTSCPVGAEHRYEDAQIAYFYGRSLRVMRAYWEDGD